MYRKSIRCWWFDGAHTQTQIVYLFISCVWVWLCVDASQSENETGLAKESFSMCGFSLFCVVFSSARKFFTVYRSVLSLILCKCVAYIRIFASCVPSKISTVSVYWPKAALALCVSTEPLRLWSKQFLLCYCCVNLESSVQNILFDCSFFRSCCCYWLSKLFFFGVWFVVAWCFKQNYKTFVHVYSPSIELAPNFY